MLRAEIVILASLFGGVKLWDMGVPSPETCTSLAGVAYKWLMVMGSPEVYYLQDPSIRSDPANFLKQEVTLDIAKITEVPILIKSTLPIKPTTSPNEDDSETHGSRERYPETDFSEYFVDLVEHLFMGLVLLILAVLYCAIIKPIHFVLSHFTDPGHIAEFYDLLDLIAAYKYAAFFWLALVLYRPVKSFMESFLTFVEPKEELKVRLRMVEDKTHSHRTLLDALDHDMRMCEADLGHLGNRMYDSEENLKALALFIEQQAMPMVLELVRFEITKLAEKFNQEAKGFTYRTQCHESELKALIASSHAIDEEIKALKAALLHLQGSQPTERIRRSGNPAAPSPLRRTQKMRHDVPGGYPNSTTSASPGSFTFSSPPGSFAFSAAPVDFTAGGFAGGFTAGGSAPSDTASSGSTPNEPISTSLIPLKRQ